MRAGAVALVTPWNSPVAIPLGKIGPALAFGNTAAWKPAPPATPIAAQLAGIDRLKFYVFDDAGRAAFDAGRAVA